MILIKGGIKLDKEKYDKPKIESTDIEIGVYGKGYCPQDQICKVD